MKPWRKIDSEQLLQNRWLSVRADECELRNGKILKPFYVIEENDWVHVFAVDLERHVLTVKQFRYAANIVCIELPGGVVEFNETPLAAAQHELLEETGFTADRWSKVAAVYANPARQTNLIHIFVAEGLDEGGLQTLDESEDIEHSFASEKVVKSQIRDGEFSQSSHIATFYLCLEHLSARERDTVRPRE